MERIMRMKLPGGLFAMTVLLSLIGHAQEKPAAPQPAEADACYQKGVALMQAGKLAEAEEAFQQAVELDPRNTRALMGQVEILMARKKPQEALDLLQDQVTKYPERVDFRLALGNAAVRAGKYDLAIDAYQEALPRLDGDSKAKGDLYLRMGETYRRKGDMQSAIASLRRAKQLLPDSSTVGGTLAVAEAAAGQTEEAERQYRAVLQLDPENALAMNNLAYLLAENGGDLDEALALAHRARDLRQDLTEIHDTVGWIYLKKNMVGAAIGVFDAMVQMEPRNPTYHYHLGKALLASGDRFAATQQLNAALRLNPSEAEAEKIKELLQNSSQ